MSTLLFYYFTLSYFAMAFSYAAHPATRKALANHGMLFGFVLTVRILLWPFEIPSIIGSFYGSEATKEGKP